MSKDKLEKAGVHRSAMAELNPQHMIEELQDNIKTGDALKARLVLAHLEEVEPKIRTRLVYLLSKAEADFLIHAFNVLSYIGDESAVQPVHKLLTNEPRSSNVRFAAYEALALLPSKKILRQAAAGDYGDNPE